MQNKKTNEYNVGVALEDNIKQIKRIKDYMALGYALKEIDDINSILYKFDLLRKKPFYKKLLIKALQEFKKKVKDDLTDLHKYGEHAQGHYMDKDHLSINKKILTLLKKEAKRLKI